MITFFGMRSRTSGITRGLQLRQWIPGARFIESAHYRRHVGNRVAIVIRHFNPDLFARLKRRGCIVGYDLLDTPTADAQGRNTDAIESWSVYASPDVDFYLVNNTACRDAMSAAVDRPVFIVPHQSVNNDEHRNPQPATARSIGYLGLPDQNLLDAELAALAARRGLEYINTHPDDREGCVSALRRIDVGVVPMFEPAAQRYKPNVKLTNFQAFGIPTVAARYDSYVEFGGGAWVPVDTIDGFIPALEALLDDPARRLDLAERSWRHAQQFHIRHIAAQYMQICARMFNVG